MTEDMKTRTLVVLSLLAVLGTRSALAVPYQVRGSVAVTSKGPMRVVISGRTRPDGSISGRWICTRCPPPMRNAQVRLWCQSDGKPKGYIGNRCTIYGQDRPSSCFSNITGVVS